MARSLDFTAGFKRRIYYCLDHKKDKGHGMSHTLLPHKNPFIIALLSMMLCVCNLHAQLVRDLIIILDPEGLETTETQPLTRLFKAAVQEGAAPIMASANLVNNAKVTFEDGWVVATNSLMVTVIPPAYIEKIRKEAQDLDIPKTISTVTLCGFNFDNIKSKKSLNAEEKTVEFITKRLTPEVADHEFTWNIYVTGHGYYVFEIDETAKPATEKAEMKAAKAAAAQKMPSAEKIIHFLNRKTIKEGAVITGLKINNFKKLLQFFNGNNVTLVRQQQRELIKNLKTLKKQLVLKTVDSQAEAKESKETRATDEQPTLTDDETTALKKIVTQSWQATVNTELKAFEKTPQTYKKHKAAMLAADFKTQLEATIKETKKKLVLSVQQQAKSPTIKTGVLGYASCYSGGFNRYLIEKTLQELSFQSYVLSLGIEASKINFYTKILNPTFYQFFEQAKKLLDTQTTSAETKSSMRTNNIFSSIANTVGGNEWQNNIYAFWYVPGRDTFETYTTAQNTFVLGNVTVKKHITEKTPIDATNYPVVLVQPMRVMPQLDINWGTSIIPVHPHEADDLHTIRYFNAINVLPPANVALLRDDFFGHLLKHSGIFNKIFLIKSLKCPIPILRSFPETDWPTDSKQALTLAQKNPTLEQCNKRITLTNVIIVGRLPGRIHIACSYAGKNYHALLVIPDEETRLKTLTVQIIDFFLTTITERIKFEPCTDYDVAKEFASLYQYVQRKDLARSSTVTDNDVQQDNVQHGTAKTEEKAQ